MQTDLELRRGLPASIDAERTILGAVLIDNIFFDETACDLSVDEFSLDSHRRIYAVMAAMAADKQPIDIVTLSEGLRERKDLNAIGGVEYLSGLTDGLPRKPSIGEYVKLVREKATRRRAIRAMNACVSELFEPGGQALDIIRDHDTEMLRLMGDATTKSAVKKLANVIPAGRAELNEGLATPRVDENDCALGASWTIRGLDVMTTGIRKREQNIIAAWTGDGKTSMLAQIALENARKRGTRSLIFSAEMSETALLFRLLPQVCMVSHTHLRDPRLLDMNDMADLADGEKVLESLPIWIDDSSKQDIDTIIARTRMMKRTEEIDLVFVDYIQLITGPGESRTEIIENVSEGLRQLAKEENVATIVLSQLSRDEKKEKRVPRLMDLKQSGKIEQDAHVVVFPYRDEPEPTQYTGKDIMIVAKQRSGPTGKVMVKYNKDTLTYEQDYTRGL